MPQPIARPGHRRPEGSLTSASASSVRSERTNRDRRPPCPYGESVAIGGDPQDLRDTAHRMRGWADDVDADATAAMSALEVEWKSLAADAYREKLEDRRRDAMAVADSIRDAAKDVDRLADTLEERQQTLTRLLEQAGKTLEDAQRAVADGAEDLLQGAQGLADDAVQAGKDLLDDGRKLAGKLTGGLL
jgi:ABC-type transporter Mla subunit MlaD